MSKFCLLRNEQLVELADEKFSDGDNTQKTSGLIPSNYLLNSE